MSGSDWRGDDLHLPQDVLAAGDGQLDALRLAHDPAAAVVDSVMGRTRPPGRMPRWARLRPLRFRLR